MNNDKTKQEITDAFLSVLLKETEIKCLPNTMDKNEAIKTLMLTRPFDDLDDDFLLLQNKYIQQMVGETKQEFESYQFKNRLAYVDDVFGICADMLVCFDYDLFNIDFKVDNDINSRLVLQGGLQVKNDILKIWAQDSFLFGYNKPYIVNGANLKAKKVAKILVSKNQPLIGKEVDEMQTAILKLFDFAKQYGAKILIDLSKIKENEIIEGLIKKLNKKYKFKIIIKN